MNNTSTPPEGSTGSLLPSDSAPRAGLSSYLFHQDDSGAVYHGDSLEILPHLEPVDLIVTDPPYYKVKGEWWDRQWDKPAQFLEWTELRAESYRGRH